MTAATLPHDTPLARKTLRSPRLIGGVSSAELKRRWSLVQAYLIERSIDAMVVVGGEGNHAGPVRWLTDTRVTYRKVAVVYPDALMTVIEHGPAGQQRTSDGDEASYPGVGEIVTVSAFPSVRFSQRDEARALVSSLKRRGVRSVALVNDESMPAGFVRELEVALGSDVAMHDATTFFDRVKALKSDEEISLLEDAAAVQDAVFADMLSIIQPGMQDFEVLAHANHAARLRGGDVGTLLFGSGIAGKEPAIMGSTTMGGRRLQSGDALTLLIETASADGYVVELGRNLSLGPIQPQQQSLHELLVEAQALTVKLLRPGARPRDIFGAHNEFMRSRGLSAESRLYAHGQGYDLIERPLIRDDEDMVLEAGMCLSAHPNAVWQGYFGFVCDNFVIGEHTTRHIHRTASSLFELPS